MKREWGRCRRCGCTWTTPCPGGCAWMDWTETLCTACEDPRPRRIQRRRVKGWRMPEGAVYVGRGSKWGNPFTGAGNSILVDSFRRHLNACGAWWSVPCDKWPKGKIPGWPPTTLANVVRELRGKDLACWCPLDQPCHADVLLEIANQPGGTT